MKKIKYLFNEFPKNCLLVEVAEGVYWLQLALPISLKHINVWLLEESDGWTIVDTGLAFPDVKSSWELVLSSLKKPVKRVIATHFHPDHVGLAAWLLRKYPAAEFMMSSGEFFTAHMVWNQIAETNNDAMLRFFYLHGLEENDKIKMQANAGGYKLGAPHLPHSFSRLRHGNTMMINQKKWLQIAGYGHSPEHISLYCKELDVLISGDMLLPRISTNISVFATNPQDDALGDFLDSLTKLSKKISNKTLVLPSHGYPFYGAKIRIKELNKHHQEHCEEILTKFTVPHTAADLVKILFPRELDRYQTMFAMGEAISHLNYLQHRGKLICTKNPLGQYCYKIAK